MPCVTESPLARIKRPVTSFLFQPHSREAGIFLLGIAKLLLLIVHVKRETLQVVSLAMTGLVPRRDRVFHKKTSFHHSKFSVFSSQSHFSEHFFPTGKHESLKL